MTPQEFSQKIKAKYPQYANIDDTVLAQKMIAKYPEYQSQVSFSPQVQRVLETQPKNELTGMDKFIDKGAKITDAIFGGGKIGEAGVKAYDALSNGRNIGEAFTGDTSIGKITGSALQSASLFVPVGRIAGAIGKVAGKIGMKTGVSALSKIGSGALAGESFDVATNLQEGDTGTEALTPGFGTAIGAVIPGVGVAKNVIKRTGENQAPRIINSLIKPLAKDFSYGKNPGRAVAEEKIVANNFEELVTKIREGRQKVGQSIGELGDKISTKAELNIRKSLAPLDEALNVAASQNNQTLLNRLQNVKRSLTDKLVPVLDENGQLVIKSASSKNLDTMTFKEVRDFLGEIGDMTQFTGNPSDDKLVNSALKGIYGSVKQSSLDYARKTNPTLAKEFERMTEKYADLSSAEIAAKYRDKILERSNLVGLSPQLAGIGTGLLTMVATGGAATPAILAGLTGAALDKLASTPAFKTRLAAILAKKSPQEINVLLKKLPALQKLFPKGSAVSPGDRLLDTKAGQKFEKGVIDYAKNPKLGLSMQDINKLTPQERGTLVAVHNTTANKLRVTDRIGGFANPSIAVFDPVKNSFENFGDITLISPKQMLESRGAKTFAADVYSPRFPDTKTFVDYKALSKVGEKYGINVNRLDTENMYRSLENSEDVLRSFVDRTPSLKRKVGNTIGTDIKNQMRYVISDSEGMKTAYLNYVDGIAKEAGTTEKIYKGFTPSGNRRYSDLTVQNASKDMNTRDVRGGESFNYGLGSIRAKIAPELKNISAIKKASPRLISSAEFEKVKTQYENQFTNIIDELGQYSKYKDKNQFIHSDNVSTNLGEYLAGDRKIMTDMFENVPTETLNKIEQFRKTLYEMPTEYFETKFKRPVDIGEFSHAIVPEGTDIQTIKLLKDKGVDVSTYKKGDIGAQTKKIMQIATQYGLLFGIIATVSPSESKKTTFSPEVKRILNMQ